MNTKTFPRTMAAIALMASTFVGAAHAKDEAVTPMGLEVGGTCVQALEKMGAHQKTDIGDGDTRYKAKTPTSLHPDAQQVYVRCSQDQVVAVQVVFPKVGVSNAGGKALYRELNAKYKKVKGGAIPSVGDGYARFTKGANVIELDVPHMAFEYSVTYASQAFFERMRAANQRRADEKTAATRSL